LAPGYVFLYSRVRLHWGFSVRQPGATAAQLAYPLPPPTTVVGAFMNPLARLLGIGEPPARRLRGKVSGLPMECGLLSARAAAAGLEPGSGPGVVVFEEPAHIIAAPFKGGNAFKQAVKRPPPLAMQELIPVQAVGSASAPDARLVLAAVLDMDALSRCLGRRVGMDLLEEAAWSIYRVGSREGLATVEEAWAASAGTREGGAVFSSMLYQPERCVTAKTFVSRLVLLGMPGYQEEGFLAPGRGSGVAVLPPAEPGIFELRSGCRLYVPSGRDGSALALAGPA